MFTPPAGNSSYQELYVANPELDTDDPVPSWINVESLHPPIPTQIEALSELLELALS